jgi:hypothetical protein
MTQDAYPFYSIADEFLEIKHLQQGLTRIRSRLGNRALDGQKQSIKAELARHKQELNFRLKRLEEQHKAQLTDAQNQELEEIRQAELAAAQNDPQPSVHERLENDLSSSKQHWEERVKQEMGMHHILPTRPEELYKVILIYLAIFKIYEGSSQSAHCDGLIAGIKNPQTRDNTILKAKLFFKQLKNPKAFVEFTESVLYGMLGQGYVAYLMNLLSRFITYPLSDFLHFTGLHHKLPFPDEYATQAEIDPVLTA